MSIGDSPPSSRSKLAASGRRHTGFTTKIPALLLGVAVLCGCAPNAQFLWEEYTRVALDATRAARKAQQEGNARVAATDYARAETFFARAAGKAEELGPQELGRSLNNLGELYRLQGRVDDAQRAFTRALTVKELGLGRDHPDVATTLNNLAAIYVVKRRDADAAPLLERSLAIQQTTLGSEHPALGRTLRALGDVYRRLGREEEAERVEARARALREPDPSER